MRPPRLRLISLLLLVLSSPAAAQDDPGAAAVAFTFPRGFDQVIYKGLVGNVLDAVPMHPSDRLGLQRTNAVVSSTLLGRSLTVLAGLGNPILLLGGFVWGVWSAANIEPVEAGMTRAADPASVGGGVAVVRRAVVRLQLAPAADDAPVIAAPAPVLASAKSAVGANFAASARSRVVRIWLPQRAPAALR
jgi:hypothetical protein